MNYPEELNTITLIFWQSDLEKISSSSSMTSRILRPTVIISIYVESIWVISQMSFTVIVNSVLEVISAKFETIAVTFTEYSFNEKFTPFKINFSLVKEITSDSSDVTENESSPQSISEEDGQTLK